jgi:CubicO group peptidase (beta-lactamase class C family)
VHTFEEQLDNRIQQAIEEKVFPGCVIGFVTKNGDRFIKPYGHFTYDSGATVVQPDSIYDVASITKSIPGSCALLKLIDEGKADLDDPVAKYIPAFGTDPAKRAVTLRHVLTYTLDLDVPGMSKLKDKTPEEIIDYVLKAKLKTLPGTTYFYTNSTAMIIGLIIQKITGEGLDVFSKKIFFKPLKMKRTTFHPEELQKGEIVPTEFDEWRGRLVQGEVHDESTFTLQSKYYLGAAGLFSTVPDLLNFLEMLIHQGSFGKHHFFSKDMIARMHTNQLKNIGQSEGLGWELHVPEYMGTTCSPHTFGKTGFTGCLVMVDPEKGKGMAFLSNRIHPKRTQSHEAINAVRKDVATIIFEK